MPSLAKELAELISTTGQITVQNEDIVSVANTKIDGLITSDQIANVAADKIIGTLGGNYAMRVYTSPATWTKPDGLKGIKATVIGGGGGAGNNSPGTPGGTSSFGSFLSATGGTPGIGSGSFGSGGTGSGGQLNAAGAPGAPNVLGGASAFGYGNYSFSTGLAYGGGGGTQSIPAGGGGGGGAIEYLDAPAIPGPVSVTVGSAGFSSNPAQVFGAAGVVIVEEFY